MLSPVHICLLVTKDYFKASLAASYRHIYKPALTVMLTWMVVLGLIHSLWSPFISHLAFIIFHLSFSIALCSLHLDPSSFIQAAFATSGLVLYLPRITMAFIPFHKWENGKFAMGNEKWVWSGICRGSYGLFLAPISLAREWGKDLRVLQREIILL